ncbi:rod shape-determining protein MreC [Candidatus Viadribacter manganicus]|uniref:rod shape-determining protein MreC n=1 Tax=Candidatus Viadribacter manganicus TaxID=1759059 RepID=UPI0012EADB30|nr:rod shape-determining protein MreC [Candidatus Viadribacter manganicus]
MARRRSSVRRAGGGRKVPAGVALAIVLGIGAVVLIGTQAGRTPQTEGVMQTGDDGAAAAGRVATGPARASEGFFDRLLGGWNSAERIEQLEAENRELQAWRDLAERLAERNRRYESLLRMPPDTFGEGADLENSIAAQLVLDSGGPFMRTLVANAGELHGVKVGYIAVNENGLVGRVVSVGQHSSRVLMLDDYNSRIPVMGESSRVRAVLAGQAMRRPELSLYPYQLEAPRMDFIVGAQSLREGERVITSGDGGLYPRGIQVGVARREGNGAWRVALAASQQPIDFVRIIPFVPIDPPETTADPSATPPLGSSSSVAVIGRETMAPPPSVPTAAPRSAQTQEPRRQTAQNQPAVQTPPPSPPQPQQEAPPPAEPATPPQ